MSETTDEFRAKYSTIFERLDRYTPDQRAEVFFAILQAWCMGCGRDLGECLDCQDAGRCCDTDPVMVLAPQCPTCEGIATDAAEPVTIINGWAQKDGSAWLRGSLMDEQNAANPNLTPGRLILPRTSHEQQSAPSGATEESRDDE